MKYVIVLLLLSAVFSLFAQDYDFSIYFDEKTPEYKPNVIEPDSISKLNIINLEKFKNFLDEETLNKLIQNGFVVKKNNYYYDNYENFYKGIKNSDLPVFVTSSTLLHYYHIVFDEILKNTEEKYFYDDLMEITKNLRDYYLKKYMHSKKIKKEVYKRNLIYFSVPYALLDSNSLNEIKNLKTIYPIVEKELSLIKQHKGFTYSPLFIYKEDYSQYVPRGHYTASEKLKRYFLSMMWYGRMTMLIKGDNKVPKGKPAPDSPIYTALISKYDAKIQTMQAVSIAKMFDKKKELKQKWERMYKVIAFFVGTSDDLTIKQYEKVLKKSFRRKKFYHFGKKKYFIKLQLKIAELNPPKIYGGTGDVGIFPPFSPNDLDKVLSKTMGFRLFGQKFIPDSYMFSNLVFPRVDRYLGNGKPFTMVVTPDFPTRGFPRGLDVFAVLGSDRAYQILKYDGDTDYENYDKELNKLKDEFSSLSPKDWHKNLYWCWLAALKNLNEKRDKGYPKFMKSVAWQDRLLNTSLSSWTALRHDTILYAKQSYTPRKLTSIGPHGFKYVKGYAEPLPKFYSLLKAITDMTEHGLKKMKIADESDLYKLASLSSLIEKLTNISVKELENKPLDKKDYDMLNNFGHILKRTLGKVDKKTLSTILVADVHTDGNTNQVLEEGTGYLNTIIVAVPMDKTTYKLFAGPEPSYYEFKHQMNDRLTDKKWKRMLINKHPKLPDFVNTFFNE